MTLASVLDRKLQLFIYYITHHSGDWISISIQQKQKNSQPRREKEDLTLKCNSLAPKQTARMPRLPSLAPVRENGAVALVNNGVHVNNTVTRTQTIVSVREMLHAVHKLVLCTTRNKLRIKQLGLKYSTVGVAYTIIRLPKWRCRRRRNTYGIYFLR